MKFLCSSVAGLPEEAWVSYLGDEPPFTHPLSVDSRCCQMAVPLQGEENLIRLPHGCYFISIHNELPSPYRFKMLFAGGSISGPSSFIPSENPPRPQVRPDIWFASITFQRRLQELPWGVENALDLRQKHLLLEPGAAKKTYLLSLLERES